MPPLAQARSLYLFTRMRFFSLSSVRPKQIDWQKVAWDSQAKIIEAEQRSHQAEQKYHHEAKVRLGATLLYI